MRPVLVRSLALQCIAYSGRSEVRGPIGYGFKTKRHPGLGWIRYCSVTSENPESPSATVEDRKRLKMIQWLRQALYRHGTNSVFLVVPPSVRDATARSVVVSSAS